MTTYFRLTRALGIAAVGATLACMTPAVADVPQQTLVDKAKATVESFRADRQFPDFERQLRSAKAVFVVPTLVKAGFIVGGEGGEGVLLARDPARREWSYPSFHTLVGASIGLQIGAQASETVFLILTENGLKRLLEDKVKLGADAGIAIATVGAGIEGSTTTNVGADIVAYARSKGLYGGISFEGAIVAPDHEANTAYYGQVVDPAAVLLSTSARNAAADPLRRALNSN